MRFAGNVIWFVFGGAPLALLWLLGSVIFAISVVGAPLSRGAFEMAKLTAWPFGRDVIHVRELDGRGVTGTTAVTGTIGFVFNIIWALTFGWVLFLGYMISGIICCLTIIGIPFGVQSFKLAGISFWPVGRRVVTNELAREVRSRNAVAQLDRVRSRR